MPVNNEPPIVTVDNFTIQKVNSDPSNRLRYALFEGDKLLSLHGECGFAISEMIARCKGEYTTESELKRAILDLKLAEQFRAKVELEVSVHNFAFRKFQEMEYQKQVRKAINAILYAANTLKWI